MGQVVTEEKKYKSFQKMYHSPRLGELKIKVRNNSRNWGGRGGQWVRAAYSYKKLQNVSLKLHTKFKGPTIR